MQQLPFFILICLNIANISCDIHIRTTMEDDIEHTNYDKIHQYNPHQTLLERQKMHFHKNFPISKTIIHPFTQLLEELEKGVYQNMVQQIQKNLNETQKASSKILHQQLLTAITPQVIHLDQLNIRSYTPKITHEKELIIQRKIDTTLPDATEDLEQIIYNVFQQLFDLYKNTIPVDNRRVYKPGYCYVFGICSSILCNCGKG